MYHDHPLTPQQLCINTNSNLLLTIIPQITEPSKMRYFQIIHTKNKLRRLVIYGRMLH